MEDALRDDRRRSRHIIGHSPGEQPVENDADGIHVRRRRDWSARDLFGDEFVDHFAQTREWEIRQYQRAVTDWERDRYFEGI